MKHAKQKAGRKREDLSSLSEKLSAAVLGMMQSTASLQDRLARACIFELTPASMGNVSLPKHIREQIATIMVEVTKSPPAGHEGTIIATTQKMSDDEASVVIEKILVLYDDVREACLK
jgi:hypothetical protein